MTELFEAVNQLNINQHIKDIIKNYIKKDLGIYDKISDIKCKGCGGRLILPRCQLSDLSKYSLECSKYKEKCINDHLEETIMLFCNDCCIYYTCCEYCGVIPKLREQIDNDEFELSEENINNIGPVYMCKFLGHHGYNNDEKMYLSPNRDMKLYSEDPYAQDLDEDFEEGDVIIKEHSKEILDKYPDETWDCDTLIDYYMGHLDLIYYDPGNFYPTGPDGGFCHFWKCLNCSKIYGLTDL